MIVVSDKLTTESFHAFIDEQLSDEQYAKVESLLDEIPEKVEEIQQCQIVNERLREVFDATVQEAIPDDLYQLAVHGVNTDLQEGPEQDASDDEVVVPESGIGDLSVDHNKPQVDENQDDEEFADLFALSSGDNLDDFDIDADIDTDNNTGPNPTIIPDIFDETASEPSPKFNKASFGPKAKAASFVDTQTLEFMEALDLDFVGVDDEIGTATSGINLERETAKTIAVAKAESEKPQSSAITRNINSPGAATFFDSLTEDMSLEPLAASPEPVNEAPRKQPPLPFGGVALESLLSESAEQSHVFKTLEPNDALELEPLPRRQEAKTTGLPPRNLSGLFESSEADTSEFTSSTQSQSPFHRRNLASENHEVELPELDSEELPPLELGDAPSVSTVSDADAEWQKVINEINSHAASINISGNNGIDEASDETPVSEGINSDASSLDIDADYPLDESLVALHEFDQVAPESDDNADDVMGGAVRHNRDHVSRQAETESVDLFGADAAAEYAFEVDDVIKQFDDEVVDKKRFVSDEEPFSSVSSRITQKIKSGLLSLNPSRLRKNLKIGVDAIQDVPPVTLANSAKAAPAQARQQPSSHGKSIGAGAKKIRKPKLTNTDSSSELPNKKLKTKTAPVEYGSTGEQLQAEFEQFQQQELRKARGTSAKQAQKKSASNRLKKAEKQPNVQSKLTEPEFKKPGLKQPGLKQSELKQPSKQPEPKQQAQNNTVTAETDYTEAQPRFQQFAGQLKAQWTERLLGYMPLVKKNILGAGAVAFVLIGVIIGAGLFQFMSGPVNGLSRDAIQKLAIDGHVLYTLQDQDFVGETGTSITESLQWLSARIGKPVRLADIMVKGFKHKNSIIIPSTPNYAAINIYQNAKKQKMSLLVASAINDSSDAPLKCSIPSGVDGLCAWTKDAVHYVVVASLSLTRVRDFSQSILDQL